jgi:hypothetical protein
MTFNNMLRSAFFFITLLACTHVQPTFAVDTEYEFGGYSKTRLLGQGFPDNSLFNSLVGSSALDLETDVRLNFRADQGPWSFDLAYQVFAGYGDRIEFARLLPDVARQLFDRLPNDDHRLFDLTDVLRDSGKFAALHRLDRLALSYTGEKVTLRAGRQAITWGNGLFFSPMDIVNPFDPAAIDTEYKTGDDMLYGQYLRDSGDDIQAAVVFRRNLLTGDVESDQHTSAIKYHGFAGEAEYDLLVAKSYGNTTLGIGGNYSIGGAVWRGDIVVTDASTGTTAELVTNLMYSWAWGNKNVSGVFEYYFNGFGQASGQYSPADLARNPELLRRLARGQTFSLGRHYVAGGLSIELTPLWTLTPNIFANIEDGSVLVQLLTRNNLGENVEFLGALNIPFGPDGSEYGGIPSGTNEQYLSVSASLFAQLAVYF